MTLQGMTVRREGMRYGVLRRAEVRTERREALCIVYDEGWGGGGEGMRDWGGERVVVMM